jgi:hypothetical protein
MSGFLFKLLNFTGQLGQNIFAFSRQFYERF